MTVCKQLIILRNKFKKNFSLLHFKPDSKYIHSIEYNLHFFPAALVFEIMHLLMEAFVVLWLPLFEMDTVTRVQILDETVCISHSDNTLGKGMNPVIFLNFGMATGLGEGKL